MDIGRDRLPHYSTKGINIAVKVTPAATYRAIDMDFLSAAPQRLSLDSCTFDVVVISERGDERPIFLK